MTPFNQNKLQYLGNVARMTPDEFVEFTKDLSEVDLQVFKQACRCIDALAKAALQHRRMTSPDELPCDGDDSHVDGAWLKADGGGEHFLHGHGVQTDG